MFQNDSLKAHLEQSTSVSIRSAVIAERNMNLPDNFATIGNYRYRPAAAIEAQQTDAVELGAELPDAPYFSIAGTFEPESETTPIKFYFGATDSDVVIDGKYEDNGIPVAFIRKQDKEKMLYSLEDCFSRFRPRSGINKARFFTDKFFHLDIPEVAQRPRYYVSHKDDQFKYWSSYRSEAQTVNNAMVAITRGMSRSVGGRNFIDDAAPFVVYKEQVPANRIVVKMQTNVGDVDLGPFSNGYVSFSDPFFGQDKATVPVRWKIQYLENNNWVDAITFDEQSQRSDGSPIVGADGYVEIAYGLLVPEYLRKNFYLDRTISSTLLLPSYSQPGYAYLVVDSQTGEEAVYVWDGESYETFTPNYGWFLVEDGQNPSGACVTEPVNPPSRISPSNQGVEYREIKYISGLRVVVETMNTVNCSFDLIELSPRLAVDISDRIETYNITKSASDLGVSGLPVGQLLASIGSMSVFDYDDSFNPNNTSSILAKYQSKNLQIKFYEIIKNVNNIDYQVPIKTMYSDGFFEFNHQNRSVSLNLRDQFSYFESIPAPQLFLQNISLSYAVSILLDSVGFSNYVFKRLEDEKEIIIPSFFVGPDMSLAEVLQDLAVSSQSAMFFDEYNNFIVMSKGYMMPSQNERDVDFEIIGTKDYQKSDASVGNEATTRLRNARTNTKLANIIDVSSSINNVYNDGTISYVTRYIQRSIGQLSQATELERNRQLVYQPTLLWESTGSETTRSINGRVSNASAFSLSAIPLNSDLTDALPEVRNRQLVNNTIDFGEGVYWLSRYSGYFFANSEMIRYDAVQFNVSGIGNVWVTSVQEYENYVSKLPFNGKIYPTGLVRIYAEPFFEEINGITVMKNGPVAKHGRMQFGTGIVSDSGSISPVYHNAGLNQYWSDTASTNVSGITMESERLFSPKKDVLLSGATSVTVGETGFDATKVNVADASKVSVGDTILVYSGAGRILRGATITNVTLTTGLAEPDQIEISADGIQEKIGPDAVLLASPNIIDTEPGPAGKSDENNIRALSATRTGIIKNFMASSYFTENQSSRLQTTSPGTVQSSALVMTGPQFSENESPRDFISYIHRPMETAYSHFGTRMRVIGKITAEDKKQDVYGGTVYYNAESNKVDKPIGISGGSGGISILFDPETNNGYYLELIPLTELNLKDYKSSEEIHNIVFYKLERKSSSTNDADRAIPIKLWGGQQALAVDDGLFTGQSRTYGEDYPSVYDLAIEYSDVGSVRRFNIFLNDRIIATVEDEFPLQTPKNMALFVRGSAKVMFENVYAITNNYAENTLSEFDAGISEVFASEPLTVDRSFRKYAMSGIAQASYLSGISPSTTPKFNMYFEEFGTIMREAAYLNIRYDKAYPALAASLFPTISDTQGYTVSGFTAGAYGAEFLVLNNTDSVLNLDDTSGNYLRIQGITFTQESEDELTLDDFLKSNSDFSRIQPNDSGRISRIDTVKKTIEDVRTSRVLFGRNQFNLNSTYIQTLDAANDLMSWMVEKVMKPRKSVGIEIFAIPILQLGDIVSVDYVDNAGTNQISSSDSRFVVYSIEYSRDESGPSMTVYLSEVA